jgi:hypothetical protein
MPERSPIDAARLAALAACLLLPLGAFAQTKPWEKAVDLEYDHSVDFSKYHTYAWVPYQEPLPNPANHVRVTRAIERELEAKGLVKGDSAATTDLFVHYQGYREKKVKGTPSERASTWQPSNPTFQVDFSRVETGTLVIELWDGRKKDVVWQAKASEVIRREDQAEDLINEAVRRMMAAYPPKPE